MSLLDDLLKQRKLMAECPSCGDDFRVADAGLFDATRRLPKHAQAYLDAGYEQLAAEKADLVGRKARAALKPKAAAHSVNIGKVVEKVAPSLEGFPVASADCRALLEPIDYVVFQGLARTGRVDSILFVDVKSGAARLKDAQREIKALVEEGHVELLVEDHTGGAK